MDLEALNGRVALLVDDEAFFLSSVVEGLRAAAPGLDVLSATDGLAALELLDRHPIDVVVTDVQMPRLDGFGLITELINRELDVSVVVLTAFERATLRERERLSLAIECLEKPLDFDQLLTTLALIMRTRTANTLRGVSLTGLLQTLELERGQAAIRVEVADEVAWIYVHGGRLVHARTEREAGVAVAGRALLWHRPRVELHPLPRGFVRDFDASISEAMLEAARAADEADRRPPPRPEPKPIFSAPPRHPNRAGAAGPNQDQTMDNIKESLEKTSEIIGTLGVALVDYGSGMTLATHGTGINLDIAAAGNMEVMRAKKRVMKDLRIDGGIEDILITLDAQYHLLRPIGESMFLYLALDRQQANLAMARLKLANIGNELRVN